MSDLIQARPKLTDTIAALMQHGRDCYALLGNGATIRLIPAEAVCIYRKGEPPADPVRKRAWLTELAVFKRQLQMCGLETTTDWADTYAKPGNYGARASLAPQPVQEELVTA